MVGRVEGEEGCGVQGLGFRAEGSGWLQGDRCLHYTGLGTENQAVA